MRLNPIARESWPNGDAEVRAITTHKCTGCDRYYEDAERAESCADNHRQLSKANKMLGAGASLGDIADRFPSQMVALPENRRHVTGEHCFIVSHWQCCPHPAYRISMIHGRSSGWLLELSGVGGWNGGCSGTRSLSELPHPFSAAARFRYAADNKASLAVFRAESAALAAAEESAER